MIAKAQLRNPIILVAALTSLSQGVEALDRVHSQTSRGEVVRNSSLAWSLQAVEFEQLGANGYGSSLDMASLFANSVRVLDPETKKILLSMLHIDRAMPEKAAKEIKTLIGSIQFANRSNCCIVNDSMWTVSKMSPTTISAVHHVSADTIASNVNAWVKTTTHNTIADKVLNVSEQNAGSRKDATTGEIVATLYCSLSWQKPFSQAKTEMQNFFPSDQWSEFDPPGKLETMHSCGTFHYFCDDVMRAVMLPCGTSGARTNFDCLLIQPLHGSDSARALAGTINTWSSKKWKQWLHQFRPTRLELAVPKFHLHRLQRNNERMGGYFNNLLRLIPKPESFGVIGGFDIGDIKFDEHGLQVANATGYNITMNRRPRVVPNVPFRRPPNRSNNPPGIQYFQYTDKSGMILDRPFIVMIIHRPTGAIVSSSLAPASDCLED